MSRFPTVIPTKNLKLSDVPEESAPEVDINKFALTFDLTEKNPYQFYTDDLALLPESSSLIDLRSRLFFEQRRWNHYGRPKDPETLSAIRRIISLIRAKLTEADGGQEESGK